MYGNPGPLSLLPSGLGIGVRDLIRGVSVIFVFPIFLPIYGLRFFVEILQLPIHDTKKVFQDLQTFCLVAFANGHATKHATETCM